MAQGDGDRQTRDLIERLSPAPEQMQQTRGIRMPAADPGTVAPGQPASPAAATPPPAVAAGTTAPAGLPAASVTVNFASGSYALSPQAIAGLAPLGRALASPELAGFRFRIEGHTDTMGDAASNMALSQRRAEAVRVLLVEGFGIAPARLTAIGLGEAQPLIRTGDERDEPRNRRVQVVNLGG
jgi:outer membrane protein OmpA-like peptidoglycan-associated protein